MTTRIQKHRLALRNIFVRALSLRGDSHFDINDELGGRLHTLGGLLGEW